MPQFIETQFPIARLSAEAYKERKAVSGQTLTGLGKWWGRKPLILVRAAIVGMLMPASNDPKKDREIFLKILTMDDDGTWQRCTGEIPIVEWKLMAASEVQDEYFTTRGFKKGLSQEQKTEILGKIWDSLTDSQRQTLDSKRRRQITDRGAFDALPYVDRIRHCLRPEQIDGPSQAIWQEINAHIGTSATCIAELVEQLGQRQFGHKPIVGDAFSGGGSIPFEASRLGCDAVAIDINPVAGLLTWSSINLLGASKAIKEEVLTEQRRVFAAADKQITEWGIEHNERGERAEAYLYCVQVKPEGCDYYIPISPTWIVDEYLRAVVRWRRVFGEEYLQPEVVIVSNLELESHRKLGPTIVSSRIVDPFDADLSWSLLSLRGPDGLRPWINDDIQPRTGDVFQERLYCIRWIDTQGNRRYAAPEATDLERESHVLSLLEGRFNKWQREGLIPSKVIVSGYNTDQPIRERGWTYWHHLFTPRQLLTHGVLASESMRATCPHLLAAAMLNLGRIVDRNSRLCRWMTSRTQISGGKDTFYNQALNTLYNFSTRPLPALGSAQICPDKNVRIIGSGRVYVADARDVSVNCDLWITDPPYADAINYHELGDFFLAWYEKHLKRAFPEWRADARAELAVRGDGDNFRRSMVDIYHALMMHMPDNGLQVVMFTHQDPAVWADLGMILWAAGLKATSAWTISTETDATAFKKGNYVQGTVCLVLRKRIGSEPGFLDEIYPMVEDEVRRQIDSMQALDEGGEPNFNDADYQLAAYAAALKVLTQYGNIDGRDVEHEVFAVRARNEKSDFQAVIERALGIACDYLVPKGFDHSWRNLSLAERYYLRALDIESRGERRKGMYEELARGFGVTDIRPLLESDKANGARMKTPSGFASTLLGAIEGAATDTMALPTRRGRATSAAPHPFAAAPLRHLLFAIRETTAADNNPEIGRQYLRDTFGSLYWSQREQFVSLLEWLAQLGNAAGMEEWHDDSEAARFLLGRLRNDHA